MHMIAAELGFFAIYNAIGKVIGAQVDLEKVLSFLICRLKLLKDTKWKIRANGHPNGKQSKTAVYLSSLLVSKEHYQSLNNVFPIAFF